MAEKVLARNRIAVLPLSNISPNPGDEYFADGMTEEIILTLSKISKLHVIARTSTLKYKNQAKSIAEIGKELGVGSILEGSVRKANDKIRIAVNLIDTVTQEQVWSNQFDRSFQDIFNIQSEIAKKIAASLKVEILQKEKRLIDKKATDDLDAYNVYLNGRYSWNLRTEKSLNEAIDFFSTALEKDAKYALAYSGLADSYGALALLEFEPPSLVFPKARVAAEKAIQIDPNLAEAHTSLGLVRFQYDRDWEGSESEFRTAIELNANYPTARLFFADYLKAMGRFDEAIEQIKQAQQLDPMSLAINTAFGHVLYLSRQYDLAIVQYQKAVELDPTFAPAHLWFGRPYLQKGMYTEAIAEVSKALELSGDSPMALSVMGHVFASAGRKEEAEALLKKLKERAENRYVPSYWVALIYVGLENKEEAFTWLERAYSERSSWLAWIKVEPRFDPLRADSRFVSLLKRMGLDQPDSRSYQGNSNVVLFLTQTKGLKLSDYSVVGSYTRFDEQTRNKLKDLKQKILAGLEEQSPKKENYLIWAPPGSGKSFLVQQIINSKNGRADFVEINLAEKEEEEFRNSISELSRTSRPTLCFIDEVDSKPDSSWPYEYLLPILEAKRNGEGKLVFVMAGSSGSTLAEFIQTIEARPKGTDLASRVPHENRYSIPPLLVEDRILVSLVTLISTAKQMGKKVAEIEKLALYYIALEDHLASARQLREFAIRCVDRMPVLDDRVKYDHLFSPGDEINKKFWIAAKKDAAPLINSFLQVE
ncbi:MAG: tetratricopeptide repeat protein [Anaerolineales bacterium]